MIKRTRKVVEYIYEEFSGEKTLVCDLVQIYVSEISELISLEIEWVYENYIESSSSSYQNLIDEFHLFIEEKNPICRIQITQGGAGYYLSHSQIGITTCNDFRIGAQNAFQKVLKLGNTDKGVIFEKFCIALLRDLGIETKPTKVSNDKGADIFGYIKNDKKDLKYKYVFDSDVLLLCQCKLFSLPIDTSVIRKLVGDSLFIRFSNVDYVDLRHNALHLIVFSYGGFSKPAKIFAETNKVKTLDFDDIVDIAGALPELSKSRIKRYLYILNTKL